MKKVLPLTVLIVIVFLPLKATSRVRVSILDAHNRYVTIYNKGSSVFYEELPVHLPKGEGVFEITSLPSSIKEDSINIIEPQGFRVLSYSFFPPNLSRKEILKRYLNKKVQLIVWDKQTGLPHSYDAILLGREGEFFFKIGDRVFLEHPGSIVIPEIPGELHGKGLLQVNYRVDRDRDLNIPVLYLANGINWRAFYVMTLLDSDRAELKCYARVENHTGRNIQDARISLVAGELHRAYEQKTGGIRLKAMALEGSTQVRQTFEYHEYPVSGKISLSDGESREVLLFSSSAVNYKKEYIVQSSTDFYPTFVPLKRAIPVRVFIKFRNRPGQGRAIPMPAGLVRIYSLIERNHPVLLGSDQIEHTPADEEVSLFAGEAFDIKVKKRQTDFTRISRTVSTGTYEITIYNHKSTSVKVKVIEGLTGQWEIISSSHEYKKTDANHIEFNPVVSAASKVTITYRVQFRH